MKVIFTDQDVTLFNGPLFPAPKAAARGSRAPQFRIGGAGVPSAAPTAPAQFAANQWSVSTGLDANQIVLNISELPSNGGSPITALQYNIGGGWIALTGTGTGARTLTMASAGTSYTFTLRAVNAVNPGTASGTKTATSGAANAVMASPQGGSSYGVNQAIPLAVNGAGDDVQYVEYQIEEA
nr:fibronectin type III domain-containing protein [Paracoccus saliphilus]